jgi:hypothetical protein
LSARPADSLLRRAKTEPPPIFDAPMKIPRIDEIPQYSTAALEEADIR